MSATNLVHQHHSRNLRLGLHGKHWLWRHCLSVVVMGFGLCWSGVLAESDQHLRRLRAPEDASCSCDVTTDQAAVLAINNLRLYCDPKCLDPTSDLYGGLLCNYYGLGQECRACSDTCAGTEGGCVPCSYNGGAAAGGHGDSASCSCDLSPPQAAYLASLSQAMVCDNDCLNESSDQYGGLWCNYFGIGQTCRACSLDNCSTPTADGTCVPCQKLSPAVTPVTEPPTASPTEAPATASPSSSAPVATESPAAEPSAAPRTRAPPPVPSQEVTERPTAPPTDLSTDAPTAPPTPSPAEAPSDSPTPGPLLRTPTRAPVTVAPMDAPTEPPTGQPTNAPRRTPAPTREETSPPSRAPTDAPTDVPTDRPSRAPTTDAPTDVPTDRPSRAPTTDAPTERPSRAPTTDAPTDPPSRAPTTDAPVARTRAPTATPSEAPTDVPASLSPTSAPTEKSTEAPTRAPTSVHTGKPTAAPTLARTRAPTDAQTDAPSAVPSTAPSSVVTRSPMTKDETRAPTRNPTTAMPSRDTSPTVAPVVDTSPTIAPSVEQMPSAPPSAVPTQTPTTIAPMFAPTAVPVIAAGPTAAPVIAAGPTAALPTAGPSSTGQIRGALSIGGVVGPSPDDAAFSTQLVQGIVQAFGCGTGDSAVCTASVANLTFANGAGGASATSRARSLQSSSGCTSATCEATADFSVDFAGGDTSGDSTASRAAERCENFLVVANNDQLAQAVGVRPDQVTLESLTYSDDVTRGTVTGGTLVSSVPLVGVTQTFVMRETPLSSKNYAGFIVLTVLLVTLWCCCLMATFWRVQTTRQRGGHRGDGREIVDAPPMPLKSAGGRKVASGPPQEQSPDRLVSSLSNLSNTTGLNHSYINQMFRPPAEQPPQREEHRPPEPVSGAAAPRKASNPIWSPHWRRANTTDSQMQGSE